MLGAARQEDGGKAITRRRESLTASLNRPFVVLIGGGAEQDREGGGGEQRDGGSGRDALPGWITHRTAQMS